jgi:uncharacterized RDD family membrane protein YckC
LRPPGSASDSTGTLDPKATRSTLTGRVVTVAPPRSAEPTGGSERPADGAPSGDHARPVDRARPAPGDASAVRLPVRRIGAWCVDWLIISAYAGALVPLGLLLAGRSADLSPAGWNAVALVLLVAPATVWLAAWERGPRAASPGKRLLRLRVDAGGPAELGWRRSLVRSGLKVALPWELGHTTAFIFADPHASGPAFATGVACLAAAGVLAVGYLVSLFVGTGRTPYDRAVDARVNAAGVAHR